MYYKQIIYLDYLENGVKVRNTGHVKVLLHDGQWSVDLHIRGLYATDSLLTELHGLTGREEITLGRLCIDKGSCYFNSVYPADNIQQSGRTAADICGICVRLSDTRQIQAIWRACDETYEIMPEAPASRTTQPRREKPQQQRVEEPPQPPRENSPELRAEEPPQPPRENSPELRAEEPPQPPRENSPELRAEEPPQPTWEKTPELRAKEPTQPGGEKPPEPPQPQQQAAPQPPREEPGADDAVSEKIYEDKWTQLCHTYQVIHPFGEEAYIRLGPQDFVVLREEYQELVNNSFLLHGYYNYRHLILGRSSAGEREAYYLGVPGTYHEREKMVSVMFGFEGFESRDMQIAQGTFGYYMKRVQI